MKTVEDMGGGIVLQEATIDGVASLSNDFSVEIIRDRGQLVTAEFLDAFMPASDTFSPQAAMTVKSRTASFTEADIDLKLTNSDISKAYRSYLGWVIEKGRSEAEVRANPFNLFFIRQIIANHFKFARLKTSWKGVFNQAGNGAGSIADGFLKKTATGRAVGGDIAAGHVFAAAAITELNAYDQVNGLAELVDEEFLSSAFNMYLSQASYDKYCRNRRSLFKEHVGPGEKPGTLDERSNITFVVDPGLSGKDTLVVTPQQNLKFIANEAPGVYSINVVRQAKHWEISIRISIGFDYASPSLLWLNDKI
ncbi:hypothetical protein [uncultured Fibrella sp.]|uniref:hypothetical protein n=1 Tax=uncultured Fibrella sp. TaxID=1284596 RepID=UPI0035CA2A13